jgi:hypothetical protein
MSRKDTSKLLEPYQHVLEEIRTASALHDLALIECTRIEDGRRLPVLCSASDLANEGATFRPLAILLGPEAKDQFLPPGADTPPDEPQELRALLATLEGQARDLRRLLNLPALITPGVIDCEQERKLHENHGRCPYCGSKDLVASEHLGDLELFMNVGCDNCNSGWTEHYLFIGASDFEGNQQELQEPDQDDLTP